MNKISVLAIDIAKSPDTLGATSNSESTYQDNTFQEKGDKFSSLMAENSESRHTTGGKQEIDQNGKSLPSDNVNAQENPHRSETQQVVEEDTKTSQQRDTAQIQTQESVTDTDKTKTQHVDSDAEQLLAFIAASSETSVEHQENSKNDKFTQPVESILFEGKKTFEGKISEQDLTQQSLSKTQSADAVLSELSQQGKIVESSKAAGEQDKLGLKGEAAQEKSAISFVQNSKALQGQNEEALSNTNAPSEGEEQLIKQQGKAVESSELGKSSMPLEGDKAVKINSEVAQIQTQTNATTNNDGKVVEQTTIKNPQIIVNNPAIDSSPAEDSSIEIEHLDTPPEIVVANKAKDKGATDQLHQSGNTNDKTLTNPTKANNDFVQVNSATSKEQTQPEVQQNLVAAANARGIATPLESRVINQATSAVVDAQSEQLTKSENQQQAGQEGEQEAGEQFARQQQQGANPLNISGVNKTDTAEPMSSTSVQSSSAGVAINATTSAEDSAKVSQILAQATDSISVQSAKTVEAITQETVSIYRKDFSVAVKDKVMVMINQQLKQLDIRLDPPELGSMQVRVNLQGEQAAVSFVVQNPQAKDALEQHMQKLRDMLAESGVDVGEANIEQRDKQAQAQDEFGESSNQSANSGSEEEFLDEVVAESQSKLYKASSTGIDYYA